MSGVVFLFNAVIQALNRPEEWWNWILAIVLALVGITNLLALAAFGANSSYAHRVEINQARFLLKQDVFQKARTIK